MKTLFVFLACVLSIKSCNFGREKGNKNIVSKEIRVDNYSRVKLQALENVIYEQRDDTIPYLQIEIDENLFHYIDAIVEGNTLEIRYSKNIKPSYYKVRTNFVRRVDVESWGSKDVEIKGMHASDTVWLLSFGSGDFEVESIQCKVLSINLSGSGDAEVSGKADKCLVNINGNSDVDAKDLQVSLADIRINGSGDVDIHAMDSLFIYIDGNGDVKYKGLPYISKSINGSGSITSIR